LKEQQFKKVSFLIATELSTEAGAQSFSLHDTLTNKGEYPKEYQAVYQSNFGPPLLEPGARYSAPVNQVSPFNIAITKSGVPANPVPTRRTAQDEAPSPPRANEVPAEWPARAGAAECS
jgi:Domain of unknown function (DUF4432)